MQDPEYIKDLFSRFLADRCTPEEVDILIGYLMESSDDSALPSVEDFQKTFPVFPKLEEGASGRIYQRLSDAIAEEANSRGEPSQDTPLKGLRSQGKTGFLRYFGDYFPRWQVAAVISLLFTVSFAFYLIYNRLSTDSYRTGYAEINTYRLDDGTLVTLNAHSSLMTADFSENDQREVWLSGEAFFQVAHNTAKEFIVHTSHDFNVEVLGTEFNVRNRNGISAVVLNKGSVKVQLGKGSAPGKELTIVPGEMVEYRPQKGMLDKKQVDTLQYTSWKHNLLLFDETLLSDVARTIENQFGCRVVFQQDSIAALRFTGSSPANDLEMLLETLEKSFDLSITRNGRRILIAGGGAHLNRP